MKRLFKVMVLRARKRKKREDQWEKAKQQLLLDSASSLRCLSSRKEEPEERDGSLPLRQVVSGVLLPYANVWNEGRKEVGITLPMVVSTKPPRAYSEPTCEVLQSSRTPLQCSGVQSQPRSPCEAFPSSPTLAGTLWHSSRVFTSVKFDISLMLLERSEGLRTAAPGSPPFLGLVLGCQTVLRRPVRAQAALM